MISDLKFLVVEDHSLQRRVMLNILQSLGTTDPLQAGDGRAALKLLAESRQRVDIVISDLDMPGMDGIEFIRHLGILNSRVSVILASAVGSAVMASVEAMARAYGIHLLGVVEKPAAVEKLKALFARHRLRPGPVAARPAQRDYSVDEIVHGLRDNQFEPFFQPKVEFASGRVTGFEALARWRHPHDGIVAPSAFVQTIEASGLVNELTWCILKKTASACSSWRNEIRLDACVVSVNLSVHSLSDLRFADQVKALTNATNLDPSHLMFEVTESAAISLNAGSVLENLSRLRMYGYALAIDDFGTGYSSLQQLNLAAFTELKIDQYFVRAATRQGASLTMLQSILEMARKLKMTSVAEGIESQEEWDLLKELGADLAQGYFVARAMEAGCVADWTMQWNALQGSQDQANNGVLDWSRVARCHHRWKRPGLDEVATMSLPSLWR